MKFLACVTDTEITVRLKRRGRRSKAVRLQKKGTRLYGSHRNTLLKKITYDYK